MTTRDALIAAIAAKPGDDLTRLVAADWFEENGDSERAEFIRRQVADAATCVAHTPASSEASTVRRLFTPFLVSLDPERPVASRFRFAWGGFTAETHKPQPVFLVSAGISRGFIESIEVSVPIRADTGAVAAAFRMEPIREFSCNVPSEDGWLRFSVPELVRVTRLAVSGPEQPWSDGWRAMLDDPHLSGVRSLALSGGSRGGVGMWGVPQTAIRELTRSPARDQLFDLSVAVEGTPASVGRALAELLNARAEPLNTLSLWGNRSAYISPASELGEALWPGVVGRLCLSGRFNGENPPEFLRERFGDHLEFG